MEKGFVVFVTIFVMVSSKGCMACFTESKYTEYSGKTGSQFVKDCTCDEPGYSEKHLIWIDPNGAVIELGLGTSTVPNIYTEILPQKEALRLVMGSISPFMSGNYTCKTNFEGTIYTRTYKIEAYDSLYFVNTSAEQVAVIGEESLIRCEVRSSTAHTVAMVWYRINGLESETLKDGEKYNTTGYPGLLIKNVEKEDAGLYNCTATDISEGDSEEICINVQVAIRPTISEININIPADDIVSGDNVTMECIADGLPHPAYFWFKIADRFGNPIDNAKITWTGRVNAIIFENIQKDDAGTYKCIAANEVDNASKTIVIGVKVRPEITSFDNVTTEEGNSTQIVCTATGVPAPQILMWHQLEGLENRIISYNNNTSDSSEMYLSIPNVSREFEGVILCSADNGVDNVTEEIYLTVFYKPYFQEAEETIWGWVGKIVNMSCDHESNPPSTIVWKFQGNEIEHATSTAEHVQINKLLQGKNENSTVHNYLILEVDNMTKYGEYECTATNDYGSSLKKVHLREAFVPQSVRNVTIINLAATSVTFLIQGPDATDNAPVNGYTSEYDLTDNYNITSVHLSRTCGLDRNLTIDTLKPNSNYSIKFAAQNEVGVGPWSEWMEFVTPETSAPEPPIQPVQDHQDRLRWTAPEANGAPIDHYRVEFCPFFGQVINTTLCQSEIVTGPEFVLDKLERNTKYSFEIRAHNAHGYSVNTYEEITTPEKFVSATALSSGAIIGLAVVAVFLCLLVLDLLLLCWRRQGIIASCYFRKNKKKKPDNLQSRSLLVRAEDDTLTRPSNEHRELVYNKTTGVITGKHSTV